MSMWSTFMSLLVKESILQACSRTIQQVVMTMSKSSLTLLIIFLGYCTVVTEVNFKNVVLKHQSENKEALL